MKRFSWVLLLMAALLSALVSACSDDPGENKGPTTIRFAKPRDNDGDSQFYTNDPDDYGYAHYSWFTAGVGNPPVYKIIAKKKSGNSGYGYGMLFCVSTTTTGTKKDVTDYYSLLITINGYYQVCKVINNKQENAEVIFYLPPNRNDVSPRSDNLITGNNKKNTLEVRKTDATTFAIYFNGQYETQFKDTEPLSGTQTAYYVSIGNEKEENFPNDPVDVRFYRP